MNTIHTSQSIRKKDERSASNDPNLTTSSVLLLIYINREINRHSKFIMTTIEISKTWTTLSERTVQRSLKELEDNGYIQSNLSGDMFNRVREISTLEASDKQSVKPHVKEKSLEKRQKLELFEKFWNKYNTHFKT